MKTNLVRVLLGVLAAWALSACTPLSVLETPEGTHLQLLMVSPDQLAAMPKVPTRIRAGDTLRITRDAQDSASLDLRNLVDDSQTQNYLVRTDGTFSFRYAGQVVAAGKTPDELAAYLRAKLDAYYREPGVTVNIVASPTSKVVIGGAVRNPITLDLNAVANLEQALFAAGGMAVSADPGRIALMRLDDQDRYRVYFIDFSRVLQSPLQTQQGAGRHSIALQRGDIVFVPKSSAGGSADGVDLYINQLLPFSRSVGVAGNVNLN
ncbi:MAG TPA: polysaccharide biosynthesis/export family protein [Aquabacterium sp.]|uniref:polysaccharide biosynthesis/export family protein n=1 Tax=Aquabacterium sp. TaxID=1872578 RepID=UPI002E3184CF|nr:polysaccharide biosynthesis/export family protein [Aquabacterium sp.]HEX5357787.1 polysaccharide biosynthesis/export family protein [Aquabacterium sp.]